MLVFRLFPRTVEIFLRSGSYSIVLSRFPWDCHQGSGTDLAHRQSHITPLICLGNRFTLGSVNPEEDVTIGSNVALRNGRRQLGFGEPVVQIEALPGLFQQIRIGRDSWIDNSAVVMADLREDGVIGTGSVPMGALSSQVVAVENPARVVYNRRPPGVPTEQGATQ